MGVEQLLLRPLAFAREVAILEIVASVCLHASSCHTTLAMDEKSASTRHIKIRAWTEK